MSGRSPLFPLENKQGKNAHWFIQIMLITCTHSNIESRGGCKHLFRRQV